MTENTKQEVNATNKPPKGNSIFQRILKTNMARSAAILALMSAAPLMESNASIEGAVGAFFKDASKVNMMPEVEKNLNLNYDSREDMSKNLEILEGYGYQAIDLATSFLSGIRNFIISSAQCTLNKVKSNPLPVIYTVGTAVGLYCGYKCFKYLESTYGITKLGKLTFNINKISNCTNKLDSVITDCEYLASLYEKDKQSFSTVNLNLDPKDKNKFKEGIDEIMSVKASTQLTIKEIEKLQSKLVEASKVYEQTLSTINVNIITEFADKKEPIKAPYYKGCVEDLYQNTIATNADGEKCAIIFKNLNNTLNDFKKLEEFYMANMISVVSTVDETCQPKIPDTTTVLVAREILSNDYARYFKEYRNSISYLQSIRGNITALRLLMEN